MSVPSVGVYVHVPFCERVCPYCDFAVVGGGVGREAERRYVDALLAELRARREHFAGAVLASLYLGGGTPSLLQPASVERLVEAAHEAFPSPRPGPGALPAEVTLEVNPSTLERQRLPGFREAGVTRLSVGVQSFDDAVLKRLGRAHHAREAHATLDATRAAGFDNVSLDLIFAAPGQALADWRRDLREAVAFGPEHVSTYELVVEEGTPFALADARGQLARADADDAADMLDAARSELSRAGLEPYELTNWARPGRESAHNQRYWRGEPVLGLGMGAWSQDPAVPRAPFGLRRRNPRRLGDYLARVAADPAATADEVEPLSEATARGEAVFLALRTRAGLDARRFADRFGAPPRAFYAEQIDRVVADGLADESQAGDLRLTARGWLLSDLACEAFVALPEEGPEGSDA